MQFDFLPKKKRGQMSKQIIGKRLYGQSSVFHQTTTPHESINRSCYMEAHIDVNI